MSRNKLNTEEVMNELKSGSVFFQSAKKPNPERGERPQRPDESERPERENPKKREIRRHSYELYRDQVIQLAQLKIEFMMKGELKSMSAMVRDAIDKYLKENKTRSGRTERT